MKSSINFRQGPVMVLAALALVFAVVGTAVAGPDLYAKKLSKSKVKSIAKKQANKQIKAQAPTLSVANADTADNATNAANADNADNATNAANAAAVGGNRIVRIDFRPTAATNEVILDLNGLRMRADCSGTNDTITAETTVNDSEIAFHTIRAGLSESSGDDGDFDVGDSLNLHPGQTSRELVSQVRYISGTGDSVIVEWGSGGDIPGAVCLTYGYAIGNG